MTHDALIPTVAAITLTTGVVESQEYEGTNSGFNLAPTLGEGRYFVF